MNPLVATIGWPVVDRVFGISPHGVMIAVGFMIGAWLFTRLGMRRGVSAETANSIVFWSLVGAIVGARVGYVIAHVSEFDNPVQWLEVWHGGISLLGGITGATVANAINIKRGSERYRFFQIADTIAPCLALGIAIGRIGDLIIGDHLGRPTSWLLGWQYKGGTLAPPFRCAADVCQASLQGGRVEIIERGRTRLLDAHGALIAQGTGVHQTAFYDMLLAWLLFTFLWWFVAKARREGIASLTFAVWYGCNRLLEDSLRIDKRFGLLTGSQWTALIVVIVSVGILVYWALKRPPGPTTPSRAAPMETEESEGPEAETAESENEPETEPETAKEPEPEGEPGSA